MTNFQFAEFLKKKQTRETPDKKIDWERRRTVWLDRVTSLFTEISAWLLPYGADGLLKEEIVQSSIHEEAMGEWGRYEVPGMTITMGSETVSLTPIGMVILGGLGRVDMDGPLGKIKIVLSDSDQKPSFQVVRITTTLPGEASPPNPDVDKGLTIENRMTSAEWYFVPPDGQRTMLRVTETTFTEQLQSLVRP